MAIFQGENLSFTIVLKDEDNAVIPVTSVNDIVALLYLESNKKPYIYWAYDAGSSIYPRPYVSSTTPTIVLTAKDMEANLTSNGFLFELLSADTAILPPGRYIIQISYNTTNAALSEDKNSIQKGALVSILKSV